MSKRSDSLAMRSAPAAPPGIDALEAAAKLAERRSRARRGGAQ